MSRHSTYADIEIRILAQREAGYPVELTIDHEREFSGGFLDPAVLPWVPQADPVADGQRLFDWLMAHDSLRTAWAQACGQYPYRRIRLRIDEEAPELHVIPWELLCDAEEGAIVRHMAADAATPFSRYLAGRWPPGTAILKRPIRILVAISNPVDLDQFGLEPLDPAREFALLQAATAGLEVELVPFPRISEGHDGSAESEQAVQHCTLPALAAEVERGYHVVHFIGHAQFVEETQSAVVMMADSDGHTTMTDEADFAGMLTHLQVSGGEEQEERLRLIFLAACQSASRSPADAWRGLAPKLIQAGVPAVLAMQDLVPIESARAFAQTFYTELLLHGMADVATNRARLQLLLAQLSGAAIPVLFMRLPAGQLFGVRGQVLGHEAESFWQTLLDNIAASECTPFLGPRVTANLLPDREDLAQRMAEKSGYPFVDGTNFPRVAQFIGTIDNRRLRRELLAELGKSVKARLGLTYEESDRRLTLTQIIEQSDWSRRQLEVDEGEIHHQLADLQLPLYLTTNFDNFMALALSARGKVVHRAGIDWRKQLERQASRPHYDLDPPPTPSEPAVLHLFGTDDDLLSMVLTEDDYLDYLTRISRDYEYLLPTSVQEALAASTLLFLGYRLEELDIKVIMRGLLTNLDLARWGMLHVAVQLEDEIVDEEKLDEVTRYFQKYFADARIDVYWGSTQQFVADLHDRWLEYRR